MPEPLRAVASVSPPASVPPLVTLLQLGRRAREAESPETLGFVIVNETLQLSPYRQSALWTETGLGRVAAVSGLPQPDATAPYVQWLTALCRHLVKTQAAAGALTPQQLPEALQSEWDQWLPAQALWLPMRLDGGAMQGGGLLLARDEPWPAHELALLTELSHVYGHALAAFGARQGTHTRLLGWLRTGKARRRLLLGALLLCLVPVRLSVLAPAEVSPVEPFAVRAPLDGVIDRFEVKPNQPVKAGTPLFSLDTTALRTRLELARKAYDTAQEEYRQTAQIAVTSDKNRADVAMRRGKLQEKAVELGYTTEQFERVQVKAGRDGIAVFADANDWVGKAVTLGERILLVADPARVELTAWLPAGDRIDVKPGDTLKLYPQGSPLASFDARVLNVAYRAEVTPEGFLAYRMKAAFEPGQPMPRIGQLGTARLQGDWSPLIYVVLRRPLGSVRQWLGW